MPFCTNCGAENPRENKFCSECGNPMPMIEAPTPPEPVIFETEQPEQPVYAQPEQNAYTQPSQPASAYTAPQASSAPSYNPVMPQTVEPVATGGLLAWSIVTLLLCTIPGIVALVQTLGINKCTSVEEQQKKMKNAKIWCIVGTVLGVLAVIGQIANNS